MRLLFVALYLSIFCADLPAQSADVWHEQSYAQSPVDNPLKGLVPYSTSSNRESFPHSMEFSYFSLASVVRGPKQYDWKILESFLNEVAGRGHQAVFRFYLEYPGKVGSIPTYFVESGIGSTRWQRAGSQGRPPTDVETPDYNHPLLRQALIDFVTAMGQKYDGDPRIGFITMGLLGLWGEWHDYPRSDLFASKALQRSVMDAYAASFHQTPILLRYPAGDSDPVYAANEKMSFGYHDDSFSWNTLATRDFFFLSKMQRAGPAALTKWQTYPIGGEIRPEAWGKVFDQKPDNPAIEDFLTCVQATHVSWLMDSGMFRKDNPPERVVRALALVRKMGYEFHVPRVALTPLAKSYLYVCKLKIVAPHLFTTCGLYAMASWTSAVTLFTK